MAPASAYDSSRIRRSGRPSARAAKPSSAMARKARPIRVRRYIHSSPPIASAQASGGSQNRSSTPAMPNPAKRGNGRGSVPHQIAVACWAISATARVDST